MDSNQLSSQKGDLIIKTVLLVQERISFNVLERMLVKRGGLAVKCIEDVETVMEMAASKQADLILMDISLAHSYYQGKPVDGIKFTQLLKSNPATAKVPVILVTAFARHGDREQFLAQSGADGYISTPVIDHKAFVDLIKSKLPAEE